MEPLARGMTGSVAHEDLYQSDGSLRESVSPVPADTSIQQPSSPSPSSTTVTSKWIQTEPPQSVQLPRMKAEGLVQPSLSVTDTLSSIVCLSESSREVEDDTRSWSDSNGNAMGLSQRENRDSHLRTLKQSEGESLQGASVVIRQLPQSSSRLRGQPMQSASKPTTHTLLPTSKPQFVPTISKPPPSVSTTSKPPQSVPSASKPPTSAPSTSKPPLFVPSASKLPRQTPQRRMS